MKIVCNGKVSLEWTRAWIPHSYERDDEGIFRIKLDFPRGQLILMFDTVDEKDLKNILCKNRKQEVEKV